MRSLSIVRVTTAGMSALLLVVVMLLGAAGWLPDDNDTTGGAFTVEGWVGQLPAALEDAPDREGLPLPPQASPRLNLHGDEVSPALATYSIDRDGNLFEVHSPQTEEPRLGSPIG